MNLRRALFIAALALAGAAGPAAAQFQPPPQQQQQQMPPCAKQFFALRDETEAKGKAVMAAHARKAPLPEACKLFNVLVAAQTKLLKYAKDNETWCGIPPQIVQQITLGNANTAKARNTVCKMAANPPRPAGPSLSDALGAAIPNQNNIKTGHGTFDTLTGTPPGK